MITRLPPSEDFPEDLRDLDLPDVEGLNSKIHRQLDHEYAQEGEASLETEIRHDELTEELDRRDQESGPASKRPEATGTDRRSS